MQLDPMIVINDKNNMCRTAVEYKQRFNATKQLEFNFMDSMGSHNIYLCKSDKLSKSLHKSDQPERTVRFNILGCANILTIPVKKLKSFYKDEIGTFIEIAGIGQPVQVRDSIFEINRMINKER